MNKWTKEAYKNPRLRFGTEHSPYDPRYQTEDLSDNAMKASEYGIKNLKRILPNLITWTKEDGESFKELEELYGNVVAQYRRYLGHVTKNVGGIYDTPVTYDMEEESFTTVPKITQKEAVSFLNAQLFKTPTWLLEPAITNKINPESGLESIKSLQEYTLNALLAGDRAIRLMEMGISPKYYTIDDLLTDIENGIWTEIKTVQPIDVYRRNLQKVYTEKVNYAIKTRQSNYLLYSSGSTLCLYLANRGFRKNRFAIHRTWSPGNFERLDSKSDTVADRQTEQVSFERCFAKN